MWSTLRFDLVFFPPPECQENQHQKLNYNNPKISMRFEALIELCLLLIGQYLLEWALEWSSVCLAFSITIIILLLMLGIEKLHLVCLWIFCHHLLNLFWASFFFFYQPLHPWYYVQTIKSNEYLIGILVHLLPTWPPSSRSWCLATVEW